MPRPDSYATLPQNDLEVRVNDENGSDISGSDDEYTDPDLSSSWLAFVETGRFQALSSVVIALNLLTIFLEIEDPNKVAVFFIWDQSVLCFYASELACRLCLFGRRFCSGQWYFVLGNVLDVIVVVTGAIDAWLVPSLPENATESVPFLPPALKVVRILRGFRTLKVLSLVLSSDLSWTELPWFQTFIVCVISFNCVLMGMETDIKWSGWVYVENLLLVIYVVELTARIKRCGANFFSRENGDVLLNLLDSLIITTSAVDIWIMPPAKHIVQTLTRARGEDALEPAELNFGRSVVWLRMLRLLRVLRLVKMVKMIRPLYILVSGVASALQGVFWVLALVFVAIYAMGIVATQLVGHGMMFDDEPGPEVTTPFATVSASMFTLFRSMSGATSDVEDYALDAVLQASAAGRVAYAFFMVVTSWTLLSILTAVVSDTMISTTREQESEMRVIEAEKERMEHINELRDLFETIDTSSSGVLAQEKLDVFLQSEENSMNTARICRVPVRDVRDVFKTLTVYNDDVTLDAFVENLVDVGKGATERHVMRLEALVVTGTEQIKEHLRQALDAMERRIPGHAASESAEMRTQGIVEQNMLKFEVEQQLRHREWERCYAATLEGIREAQALSAATVEALQGVARDIREQCARLSQRMDLLLHGACSGESRALDEQASSLLVADTLPRSVEAADGDPRWSMDMPLHRHVSRDAGSVSSELMDGIRILRKCVSELSAQDKEALEAFRGVAQEFREESALFWQRLKQAEQHRAAGAVLEEEGISAHPRAGGAGHGGSAGSGKACDRPAAAGSSWEGADARRGLR